MDIEKTKAFVEQEFTNNALPALRDYIRIPNLSKNYDENWKTNGLLEKAANHLADWVLKQNVAGLSLEILNHKEENRTPLIFMEVEGDKSIGTVLIYGHYDKQPHGTGWREGLSPTDPVIEGDYLYGRGSSDDGYSTFAAILSIKAIQAQNIKHPRFVIIIEGDEESTGEDLPYYLKFLEKKIGNDINLAVALDSGAVDYDTMWITTSLRGVIIGELNVHVLSEGVHSGDGSGVVPSSFRIMRKLLDRIDNPKTGEVVENFQVNIPPPYIEEAHKISQTFKSSLVDTFPWHKGTKSTVSDPVELYLNRNWRPQLSCTGISGYPECSKAGNVLLPETTIKLSLRTPPSLDSEKGSQELKKILEANPPYDAEVSFTKIDWGNGWFPSDWNEKLMNIIENSSKAFFGKVHGGFGEGGSIPFLNDLKAQFPKADWIVTGILGPNSNAHGPNESLHIPYTKKIIAAMAYIFSEAPSYFKK